VLHQVIKCVIDEGRPAQSHHIGLWNDFAGTLRGLIVGAGIELQHPAFPSLASYDVHEREVPYDGYSTVHAPFEQNLTSVYFGASVFVDLEKGIECRHTETGLEPTG
jgi:hypothetical protein